MPTTIALAGAVAQKARHGGHAWVYLQYLLGLRRLGYDVLFLDRAAPGAGPFLRDLLGRFGLDRSFALAGADPDGGLPRAEALARLRDCALLVNVMGFLDDEELLAAAPRRAYLDIDPGFPQLWRELGLADPFAGHDAFATIGERLGEAGCPLPTCGLDWVTTPQPVVLERWPVRRGGERWTSVATWRGAYGPVEWRGRTYGLRVHEFRRFAELPRLAGRRFELALGIHPGETRDLALLAEHGWRLVDPERVAGDVDAYRDYVGGSRAELTVAKGMYVEGRSGWFSDRSICYLASGKPVVAQDTGFPHARAGLLAFSTVAEAVAAVAAVEADYDAHAAAARALAEERFDSDVVLPHLLRRLGVG